MFLVDWFYGVLASLGLWQKDANILFLWLDNAGKTSLLHMVKDERLVQHQPYTVPHIRGVGNIKFKAFDLGGHQIARRVWRDYYATYLGWTLLFILWMLMTERFPEARRELDGILSNESLTNVPFLILGNKIDIPYSASEDELCHHSGLTGVTTGKGNVNLAGVQLRCLCAALCARWDMVRASSGCRNASSRRINHYELVGKVPLCDPNQLVC